MWVHKKKKITELWKVFQTSKYQINGKFMSVVSVVCCWIFSHILLIHLKYMYFVESSFFLKMIFYYFNKEKNIKNILDISEFNQFEKWKIKFKVKSPSKKIMYSHTISDIPSHKFTTHLTPHHAHCKMYWVESKTTTMLFIERIRFVVHNENKYWIFKKKTLFGVDEKAPDEGPTAQAIALCASFTDV